MTMAFLSRTYDEAMSLLVETRNYLSFRQSVDGDRIEPLDRLKLTREAFRLTSRLAQVMAWLMLRRAVVEGEIADDEARRPEHSLAGHDVCLGRADDLGDWLPEGMRGLLVQGGVCQHC